MKHRPHIHANGQLVKAFHYARAAHNAVGQVRKYTGEPYWNHPLRVMYVLIAAGETDPEILIAALLHDVVEDVGRKICISEKYDLTDITSRFGLRVRNMVDDLTDEFTKENYPDKNRATRKTLEGKRLGCICVASMEIKLADIVHNSASILMNDKDFGVVYLQEIAGNLREMEPVVRHNPENRVLQQLFTYADWQVRFAYHPLFAT